MDLAVQACLIGRQPLLVQGSTEEVYPELHHICSHLNLSRKTIDYFHDAEIPTSLSEEERAGALVIVALNLHNVSRNAQIQALELLRLPKTAHFLFIALLPIGVKAKDHITTHVADQFFFEHIHSTSSFSSTPLADLSTNEKPSIAQLQKETSLVRTTAEMRRYVHNIVTFLRLHRAVVATSISALSSRQLTLLARILATLNGLSYVTPSLVAMAARKVFAHRLEIPAPDNERSMQWGSDREAVAQILQGYNPESVIEEVLANVECPL